MTTHVCKQPFFLSPPLSPPILPIKKWHPNNNTLRFPHNTIHTGHNNCYRPFSPREGGNHHPDVEDRRRTLVEVGIRAVEGSFPLWAAGQEWSVS